MDKCSEISEAMDRLIVAARDADHTAKDTVTVKTSDLIEALREMDRDGLIDLDLD
jgi:hypothetical protein